MLVLSATLQLVQMHNLCSLLMKLAGVCLSVYRVLFFQITTQKIRHLELQYCTFFTLLLYKLHELILLDFLPSCYILDNQVILPGKLFLPPTCPGTSFVKNICRTLWTVSLHCVVCFLSFQRYEKLAKAQLKKVTKLYAQEKKKSEEQDKKEVTVLSLLQHAL